MNFIIHDIYSTVEVTSDPTHPLKKSAIITASFFHLYSDTFPKNNYLCKIFGYD